jgi:hypothetical protein
MVLWSVSTLMFQGFESGASGSFAGPSRIISNVCICESVRLSFIIFACELAPALPLDTFIVKLFIEPLVQFDEGEAIHSGLPCRLAPGGLLCLPKRDSCTFPFNVLQG